ncbi:MAG: TatD family hydrolase [Chloroflexota bacterium]
MNLTDTHCHLDFHKFDPDRAAVLDRAARAGVERILIPGLTLASSLAAVELAESHPMLFAAIGVHPTESLTWTNETQRDLKSLIPLSLGERGRGEGYLSLGERSRGEGYLSPRERGRGEGKIVAIGEIGLDYYWDAAPRDLQQRVLREQLDLAAELSLPVVIHMREKGDAPDGPCARDLLEILGDWVAGLRSGNEALAEAPGVLHSFSGSLETARQAIRLGFYIGITGPVTYKNAESKREVVKSLPLERLLIETDAPFLAPASQRGKRNEPAFVYEIADKIAQLHSRSLEEVAAVTSMNAARLFSWGETF